MSPEDRDAAYLWDIVTAAREIMSFVSGITFYEFTKNKMLRYAVERQLIVIGEAARKVSDAFKSLHGEVPWSGIIGQRNIIAQEYGEILVERIWYVATDKIPELIRCLEPVLPDEPPA
jgi:uncharacterized protein with HEPN domain